MEDTFPMMMQGTGNYPKKRRLTIEQPTDTGLPEGNAWARSSSLPEALDKAAIMEAASSYLPSRKAMGLRYTLHRVGYAGLLTILEHVVSIDLHICV